jgi:hypothetical protein
MSDGRGGYWPKRIVVVCAVLLILVVGATLLLLPPQPEVVGTLSETDTAAIVQVIRRKARITQDVLWERIQDLPYRLRGQRKRSFVIQVLTADTVRVVIDRHYLYELSKEAGGWEITAIGNY